MKIGIYSGSFNPVHVGHVALADYVVEQGLVDEVWMIRSLLNPLKKASGMMADSDRLRMLELAIEGHPGLRVSTIEDQLPVPNYTITTLRTLQATYPDDEFHLIVGADNWQIFQQWREWESILRDFHLIVYPRPGYPIAPQEVPHVRFIDAPLYDISSTQIRECLEKGLPLTGLVDDKVAAYLQQL
ncbi:MAG: nicotinate (nicotinamide) nucleotide adenylyltransferase [Bacteroidales bacterium]|nr:nicotinate (nicotinamide) nucleotide adenylyltransferase [Bacteroidales bacterium]